MTDEAGISGITQTVGARKGGAGGHSAGRRRRALKKRRRTLVIVAALVVCLIGPLGSGGEPTRSGVGHVEDVAVNGSGTSGFVGAAEESGLVESSGEVSEVAGESGIPTVILYALVAPSSGPWRAETDSQIIDNARTVAGALNEAKAGIEASAGWDLTTGTVMCQGDRLVIAGDKCPSGAVSDAGGAEKAKQVREAWVAAMMAVQGLPSPRSGTVSGAAGAPAAPEALEGSAQEKITRVATSTYSLQASTVTARTASEGETAASQVVTVSDDDPLPLATTLVTRYREIGIAAVQAAGRTWTPEGGWTTIDAVADETDPTASTHVRAWVCESGWGAQCSTQTAGEAMSREQADQVYSQALSWFLGTPTKSGTTCTTRSGGTAVAQVTSATGETVTIGASQAGYVAAIINTGRSRGESDANVTIALMTALTESRLQMYANSTVPDSLGIAHDAMGADHDSVGLFQQRPSMGWGGGDVSALMDAGRSAGFFFDALDREQAAGTTGSLGEQAQAVQASGFPERYAYWQEAAQTLLSTTAGSSCTGADVPSASGWGYPLPEFSPVTSDWDPARMHPVLGYARPHWGTDIGAPMGTPVLSATDGTVRYADCDTGSNGLCAVIVDSGDGWRLRYLHVVTGSFQVHGGDRVTRGQQLAQVGNTGVGTGAHLHVETSKVDLLGQDVMWCPFDASYTNACPNPMETFSSHGVDLATGQVTEPAGGGTGKILEFARTKIGGSYTWGGEGPDGFDCSGLVKAAYASIGVSLDHSAAAQCSAGQVIDQGSARAGDIVCWGSPAYHVALYNGSGGLVGAQDYGTGVVETALYGDHYFVRIQ